MKKLFYTLSFLTAAAMTTGITSCQSEEVLNVDSKEAVTLEAVAQVSFDDETRTAFELTKNAAIFKWTEGDQLVVISDDGTRNIGVMALTEIDPETNLGQFSGPLTLEDTDEYVRVYYMGKNMKDGLRNLNTYETINISDQKKSTYDDMTGYGIMCGRAKLQKYVASVSMQVSVRNLLTYAHYYFHLPEGVTATDEVVTVKGENVKNQFKLMFADATLAEQVEGGIEIKPEWTGAEGGAYMVYVPAENLGREFEVTIGGKTYKSALKPFTVKANDFMMGDDPTHGRDVYFTEDGAWTLTYKSMDGKTVLFTDDVDNDYLSSHTFTVKDYTAENGYKFEGWSTEANGAVEYNAGDDYKLVRPETEATLYAVLTLEEWAQKDYTLIYMNDGVKYYTQTNHFNSQTKMPWLFKVLANDPVKAGHTFLGWAETDGGEVKYHYDDSIDLGQNSGVYTKTLYAIWKQNKSQGEVKAPGSTGTTY